MVSVFNEIIQANHSTLTQIAVKIYIMNNPAASNGVSEVIPDMIRYPVCVPGFRLKFTPYSDTGPE
jgi:hypothetical protein